MILPLKIQHWIGLKDVFSLFRNLSAIFILFMTGCTSEMLLQDSFVETLDAGISRRSVPVVVTICSDAYITIGGGGSLGDVSHTVYKGTTCRTCLADEIDELGTGEYEAGGFPEYGTAVDKGSGGGGNGKRYYVGDKWEFTFSTLAKIYAYGSTLNAYQKGRLENVISEYNELPKPYPNLYNRMVQDSIRIVFKMDPTSKYLAYYNKKDKSISFQSESAITAENLSEEIIHAIQHQVYYGDKMNAAYKNYEFEAKVFHDFTYAKATLYDNLDLYFAFLLTMTSSDVAFNKKYVNWIKEWGAKGYLPPSEYLNASATYNEFCKQWKGYSGDYLNGFIPRLLEAFFRKADPPINPNYNEY